MNTNIPTAVSESMIFLIGKNNDPENLEWIKHFKEKIDSLPNAEDFREMYMICIENDADNHYLQEAHGITIAMNLLRKDAKAKVLLYGVLPMEYLRKKKPEIDLVLKHENVRIMEIPFKIEDLAVVFQKPKEILAGGYTVTEEVKKYLSSIFHDLKYVPSWDTAVAHDDPKFKGIMEKVKGYFSGFADSSPETIIEFLKSVSDSREEVMKGMRLSGVYCDVEGTLLVNGQLNEKVAALLKEYVGQRKEITIWTDGDLEELKAKLEELGIHYPVKSKFDHSGAIAEIVIDDQDEFIFAARTKISAEKFIRTSDIV